MKRDVIWSGVLVAVCLCMVSAFWSALYQTVQSGWMVGALFVILLGAGIAMGRFLWKGVLEILVALCVSLVALAAFNFGLCLLVPSEVQFPEVLTDLTSVMAGYYLPFLWLPFFLGGIFSGFWRSANLGSSNCV